MPGSLKLLPILLLLTCAVNAQFGLTVVNGYGSGQYIPGDTVHIWSQNNPPQQVFNKWESNDATPADASEWHTTLIMPARQVVIGATFKPGNYPSLTADVIRGVENDKAVYYAFPSNYKGLVICFHGTGGAASNWAQGIEYRQFVNDLLAAGFAVMFTEAEEVTLQQDLDMDGGLRWHYTPIDPAENVDMGNIAAILDTLENRGLLTGNTPVYTVGMSNGGGFAPVISYVLNFDATAVYCAGGSELLFGNTNVPTLWCMQQYDQHPQVGAAGNQKAREMSDLLKSRGICSEYHLNDHSPLYPQRLMRGGFITEAKATTVFNELKSNNLLDENNYVRYPESENVNIISASPENFPEWNTMVAGQQLVALSQMSNCFADHHFFSDYNRRVIRFFDELCANPGGISEGAPLLHISPNPAENFLVISAVEPMRISVVDVTGKVLMTQDMSSERVLLDISTLTPGCYFLKAGTAAEIFVKQ